MQVFPAMPIANLQGRLVGMESIHARIKRLRLKNGLSLPTFAKLVGVEWQSAQQWEKETGGTAPSRKRQAKVAEVLGVSVQELMHGGPGKATANELGGLLSLLTKEQRDRVMQEIRSMAAANKAIAKEISGQFRPVDDVRVREALKPKAKTRQQ